jgi:hypothetical protein
MAAVGMIIAKESELWQTVDQPVMPQGIFLHVRMGVALGIQRATQAIRLIAIN